MSEEQSMTIFDLDGNTLTVKGPNMNGYISIIIESNKNAIRFKANFMHQASIVQSIMEAHKLNIDDKNNPALSMVNGKIQEQHEIIFDLQKSIKSTKYKLNYYKGLADKKLESYSREMDLLKGENKALKIYGEVYTEANETLKSWLAKKDVEILELKEKIRVLSIT